MRIADPTVGARMRAASVLTASGCCGLKLRGTAVVPRRKVPPWETSSAGAVCHAVFFRVLLVLALGVDGLSSPDTNEQPASTRLPVRRSAAGAAIVRMVE